MNTFPVDCEKDKSEVILWWVYEERKTLSLSALSILTPALPGATLAGGPYPTILLPAVRSQPGPDAHI